MGGGEWGGEGSAAPPRLSAALRVVAAPWPVPVTGARWRSASRNRHAARLHPRGAPRPRCRRRKTRAALGGRARSWASPGGVPRSPAQLERRWKRGAGGVPSAHACPRARSGVGGATGVGWVGAQRRSVPRCHEGSRTVAMGFKGREIKHGPLVPAGLRVVWAFLRISPQSESQHPRWGWTTLSSRQRGHPSQIHPQHC